MDTKNVKCFQEWILSEELLESGKIRDVIQAFSEYMVATNPNYLYNKTYLTAFIDDFLNCTEKLKKKKKICEYILKIIKKAEISTEDIIIRIDRAWISNNSEIELANEFDCNNSASDNIKYEIECVGEKSFVIADSINVDMNGEYNMSTIERNTELFIKKYKGELVWEIRS